MDNKRRKVILSFGIVFLLLEVWKQLYLYFVVFNRHYDIWYFPFQLCSMPIYIPIIYGLLSNQQVNSRIGNSILYFMQDYFLIGGVMALIVRDGFTFPEYPLLTLHGTIWHIGMIALSVYVFISKGTLAPVTSSPEKEPNQNTITKKNLTDDIKTNLREFAKGMRVYLLTAAIAIVLNILLHPFGDADMYYISPYHISTQPVFRDLDLLIGRIPGIIVYMAATIFGAFLAHLLYQIACFKD